MECLEIYKYIYIKLDNYVVHELPSRVNVKSGTIRLASGFRRALRIVRIKKHALFECFLKYYLV